MRALPRPSLDEVNSILALFRGGDPIRLERTVKAIGPPGRPQFRLTVPSGSRSVRISLNPAIRGDGLWFRYHRAAHRTGLGGTEEQAIVQLVLWYRGRFRKPLGRWKGWCGHLVNLGRPGLFEALAASSYNDSARTCCVLCGDPDPRDWWSRDGVTGPACRHVFDGVCPGRS